MRVIVRGRESLILCISARKVSWIYMNSTWTWTFWEGAGWSKSLALGTSIQILASPLCDLESLEVYNFSEMGMMIVNIILTQCKLNKMMPENHGALNALTTVTAQSMVANLSMAITTCNTYWTGGLLTEELGRRVLDSIRSRGTGKEGPVLGNAGRGLVMMFGAGRPGPITISTGIRSFLERTDTSSLSVSLLSPFRMVLWVTSLEIQWGAGERMREADNVNEDEFWSPVTGRTTQKKKRCKRWKRKAGWSLRHQGKKSKGVPWPVWGPEEAPELQSGSGPLQFFHQAPSSLVSVLQNKP